MVKWENPSISAASEIVRPACLASTTPACSPRSFFPILQLVVKTKSTSLNA